MLRRSPQDQNLVSTPVRAVAQAPGEQAAAGRRGTAGHDAPSGLTPPATPRRELPAYPLFLRTSMLLALTLGFALGATLLWTRVFGMPGGWGFQWWMPHAQMHGVVQVFGFIGLFIMGVGLHVVPRLKGVPPPSPRLGRGLYGAILAGLALRFFAQIPSELYGVPGLSGLLGMAGGALLLGGSLTFASFVLGALRRTKRPADGSERYFGAAVIWLSLGAAAQLAHTVYLGVTGQTVVPDAYNEPVLHALLVGFAATFTFAISLRVLPVFLNIAEPSRRGATIAFWLLTAGLAVRIAGSGGAALLDIPALADVARAGTLVEAAGLIAIALTLAPWRKPRVPLSSPGGYNGYVKFIRTAYVWLIIAAALEAGLALRTLLGADAPAYFELSAARHALALGFLTLMVLGAAMRMVPAFGGTLLAWPRLGDAAFWLVLASVSLRVPFTLTSGPWPELAAALNGTSGVLGTVGLLCWSASIWRTLRAAGQPARAPMGMMMPAPAQGQPTAPAGGGTLVPLVSLAKPEGAQAAPAAPAATIRGGMTPAEVLERYPHTLRVFLGFGFEPLRDPAMREAMGRSVTLAQAAGMMGLDLASLLAALNEAATQSPLSAPGSGRGAGPGVR